MKKFKKPQPVVQPPEEYTFDADREKICARFRSRAEAVYCGRNREVFVMRGYVVKVPLNGDGVADNDWEGSVSNCEEYPQNDYQVQYARTRMVIVDDIPIVFMERLEDVSSEEIIRRLGREPKWCWAVDGGQVGFNKQGRLLAYDYGIR